jgi:CRP-like cAMP-binding protein
MTIENLERIIGSHPFFAGLGTEFCSLVCGCARNVVYDAGDYLLREGQDANEFYLVRAGRVIIELAAPGRGAIPLMTVGDGEIVGLSWLIPPYRWRHDARALTPVRALGIDARCLRDKCEADPRLGYELMKRVVPVLLSRLESARLQMLDVYGDA